MNVALISDAGTPLISDPGNVLIQQLIQKNYNIVSIPGPSSVLTALVVSGFELNEFQFFGFKLGFWFAQQGSIYTFVILIFIYIFLMNRLDKFYRS